MADKIVVMRDGVIEQIGTPLDLYDFPTNVFVAGFIGSPSMNFIRGKMTADGFLAEGGTALPTPLDAPGAVTYGIRPENIHIATHGLSAQVVVVEPMGSETQVIMRLGGQQIVGIFRDRIKAKPGDTLQISIDPAVVHLFDSDEKRIMT